MLIFARPSQQALQRFLPTEAGAAAVRMASQPRRKQVKALAFTDRNASPVSVQTDLELFRLDNLVATPPPRTAQLGSLSARANKNRPPRAHGTFVHGKNSLRNSFVLPGVTDGPSPPWRSKTPSSSTRPRTVPSGVPSSKPAPSLAYDGAGRFTLAEEQSNRKSQWDINPSSFTAAAAVAVAHGSTGLEVVICGSRSLETAETRRQQDEEQFDSSFTQLFLDELSRNMQARLHAGGGPSISLATLSRSVLPATESEMVEVADSLADRLCATRLNHINEKAAEEVQLFHWEVGSSGIAAAKSAGGGNDAPEGSDGTSVRMYKATEMDLLMIEEEWSTYMAAFVHLIPGVVAHSRNLGALAEMIRTRLKELFAYCVAH